MGSFYLCSSAALETELSPSAFKVYSFLAMSANNVTRDSYCKRSTIASKCHLSKSSVARAFRELLDKGLLEIRPRFLQEGRQTTNLYVLLDNQQLRLDVQQAAEGGNPPDGSFPGQDVKSSQNGAQDNIHLFPCESGILSHNLSPNELKVFSCISARADHERKCYPSYKDLATDCHISVPTVFRSVKRLREKGFLDVIPQTRNEICGNNGRSSNLYILKNIPPLPDAGISSPSPTSGQGIPDARPTRTGRKKQRRKAKRKAYLIRKVRRNRRKHRHVHLFHVPMTPSPMSPVTPQRTMSRKKVTLKQGKKELCSKLTKWYRLHIYPNRLLTSKWGTSFLPP